MDQQQYEIACEIIALDCTGQGQLKDGKGNFCAIGGLYAAIDPDWAVSTARDSAVPLNQHYKEVEEVFGIKTAPIHLINDRTLDLNQRRRAVKAVLAAQLEDGS